MSWPAKPEKGHSKLMVQAEEHDLNLHVSTMAVNIMLNMFFLHATNT